MGLEGGIVFMSHPTEVLNSYLSSKEARGKFNLWEMGRLSMALEILTQIKILDSLPFTTRSVEVGSALQTLLTDTGMADEADKWYERLDAWRAPKFVSSGPGTASVHGAVSARGVHSGSVTQMRRLHASLEARRGQDNDAISSSGGLRDEEEPTTPSV